MSDGGEKEIDHFVVKSVKHARVKELPQARVYRLLRLDHEGEWVEEWIEEELLPVGVRWRRDREGVS